MPSNDERGYVLRRIMRRGIRFGYELGLQQPFLHEVCATVIEQMGEAFGELRDRASYIEEVVHSEEERFRRTLDRGSRLLDDELAAATGPLSGAVAFKLHDTYGFPFDLTELIAQERGVAVDKAGFDAEMAEQRARGRAGWTGSGQQAVAELWHQIHGEHGDTRFTGHDRTEDVGTIVALVRQTGDGDDLHSEATDRLEAGQAGVVVLDKTPFYAESGGQVGDAGTLGGFVVRDTTKAGALHLHHGEASAPVSVGDAVTATVDADRRDRTRRNHTGTHLLHAALRAILGDHVTQKGSLVGPDRLRFDFSHHKPVTDDELAAVELWVNQRILGNIELQTSIRALDDAMALGAMALFGEKYDEQVRVVEVPGASVELCGGTHCGRTGDIGLFRLVAETGVAAGVRRIEAQTGTGALAVIGRDRRELIAAARSLKTEPARVVEALGRLVEERRQLEGQLAEARRDLARLAAGDLVGQAREVGGVQVLAAEFDGDLKEQADRLRDQLGTSLVVLFSHQGQRVRLVAAVTRDIAGTRLHAGNVLREIAPLVGGKGGGRPDLAQGGGSDPGGIPTAVDRVYALAAEALAS